ncbi:MAG: NUDIX hydrolase [Gemmatimonadota bacterium]
MLLSTKLRYHGRVFDVRRDLVRFPDGSEGTLDMIRHPGATAILPFLDDPGAGDPRVLLIRQFRHAADDFIWEVPAGTLGPGEPPEQCARRELTEETGYSAKTIRHLTTIFTTPGFTDEKIHLYLATGLVRGKHHREADEFITVHSFRWSEIGQMIRRGEIHDGKTLATLMYLQCFGR